MAFKVAEALGCDPIVLIGQDLAFSKDGQTHASGSIHGEKKVEEYQKEKLTVKGNYQTELTTTTTWYKFLKSYELDLANYKGTCINSTEGGAFIEGTIVMSFHYAINKFINKPYYPLDIIKNELSSFDAETSNKDYYIIKNLIRKSIDDMQSIIEKCEQGLCCVGKHKDYLKNIVDSKDSSIKTNQLDEIAAEILKPKQSCPKEHHHTFQLFFMHILQSYNIKFEMEILAIPEKYENNTQAYAETLLRSSEWYSVVKDLAKVSLNLLNSAAKNIDYKETKIKQHQRVYSRR